MVRAKEKSNPFENRIHELDLFRGFLIILVIFDHLMWFINFYCFHSQQPFLLWYWTSDLRKVVREIVLYAFMFTCGISCYLSANNLKRGLLLLCLALGITIGTRLIQPLPMFANRIIIIDFNMLGVIAISILLWQACSKLKDNEIWMVVAILIVFFVFINISKLNDTDTNYYPLKSIIYTPFNPIKEGYVADYLPLFPYVIFLFFGGIFGRKILPRKRKFFSSHEWERPICFLGRHTLIIYIAHEIIFTLIFMGIGALIG